MEENNFTQDYFINEDGYINLRLKVTTEDKEEREKIVALLMGKVLKDKGFVLSDNVEVDQIYFKNQNPKTVLNSLRKQLLSNIENVFDETINNTI